MVVVQMVLYNEWRLNVEIQLRCQRDACAREGLEGALRGGRRLSKGQLVVDSGGGGSAVGVVSG